MILEKLLRILYRTATPSFFIFWLLMGVVGSVVYGLSMMIRGLSFAPFLWFALSGLALSWVLAGTRLKNWVAAILFLMVGMGVLFSWGGEIVEPAINLLRASIQITWETASAFFQENSDYVVDLTSVQLALSELRIHANAIWVELVDWLGALSSKTPVYSSTSVLLTWGLAIWGIATWAGWVHRRYRKVVLSIFPGCLLLVITQGYTYDDSAALIPLLFSTLLLIALTWLDDHEKRWKAAQIDYPEDVRLDSVMAFAAISIGLVALAYFVPRISIRKMVEMVREFTNPQVEQAAPFIESLGIEPNKPNIGRFGSMLDAGMPRSHLIGAGPELSEQIVFSAQITAGLPPGAEADDAIPLYWRGLTYDQYTGVGWESSDVSLRHYRSDQQVGIFERPGYWILEQDIRFLDESELLFAAGDLISVDEGYKVAWRSEPWLSDIEQFPGDFFGASTEEISYRAQSFVPVVDANTLRASGRIYPDWIRENYVLVPIETPQRVVNFTRTLIEGFDNPYDRAYVIEQYLRQFEYTTELPPPPTGRDIVDYFLFDLKKGYCDYFATSMVVMARVADLPARLVVGYARGTYDGANDRYVISEANAHSWPEIYFEGIGWVPFEPTSGLKEIARSDTPLQFPGDNAYVIEAETLMGGIKPLFGSWLLTFGILTLGVIWFIMVWVTFDEWLLRRYSPAKVTTRLYWRLYNHGRRLGVPAEKDDTPFDFAKKLRRQYAYFFAKSMKRSSLRQVRQDILNLTYIYTQVQFSSQGLVDEDQDQILAIWQRLRRPLVFARAVYWLNKFRPRYQRVKQKDIGEQDE